jgi:hypothetical protein
MKCWKSKSRRAGNVGFFMELHNRTPLGKEAAILGSRYVTQTDDDRVSYRVISSCGVNLLFEVTDGYAYLVASDGALEELEDYARFLAEDDYPARRGGAADERGAPHHEK